MAKRLWYMFTGWGFVGVIYSLTDALQRTGTALTPSFVDRWVPFSANAIWCYLSFFLIVPLAYLSCPVHRLPWLRTTTMATALCAGAVYLAWPTTMAYPDVPADNSLSVRLLTALMQVDSPQNCLPSLHMALTLLSVLAMDRRDYTLWRIVNLLWGIAIGFSILQLRRHLFIDLVSGAALALLLGAVVARYPSTFSCRHRVRVPHD